METGTTNDNAESVNPVAPEVTYTDNYDSTLKALLDFIVANAPASLRPKDREALLIRQEACARPGSHYLELRQVFNEGSADETDARADVTIALDSPWNTRRLTDSQGNMWRASELRVTVNYGSHGSAAPEVVERRLAIIQEAVQFAKLVASSFQEPVWSLLATVEELEEQKRNNALREVQRRVESWVHGCDERKHLRLHKGRDFLRAALPDVPPGKYTVACDFGKEYRVNISEDSETWGFIFRTK